jgi:hypothetical protein
MGRCEQYHQTPGIISPWNQSQASFSFSDFYLHCFPSGKMLMLMASSASSFLPLLLLPSAICLSSSLWKRTFTSYLLPASQTSES